VKQLNATTGLAGDSLNHNAKVLNQAKQALIGYVAPADGARGEDNPGRLPCPEPPGNYGTAQRGDCQRQLHATGGGRLPWRTLGLDKLLDAPATAVVRSVSRLALSNSTTRR